MLDSKVLPLSISIYMKNGGTLFLKIVLSIIALGTLSICVYLVATTKIIGPDMYRPIVIGLCVSAVPFLTALYQAFKLLTYIDKKIAFSELSVKALQNIKYCAIIIACLFIAGLPYLGYVAEMDDAPGAMLGGIIAIASIVIAVFAAVLQKLVRSAIDLKTENELTV